MTAFGQPLLVLAAAVDVPTPLPDGCECLVLHEDFSIGPLQDADAIDAQWRTSWWNQLHWAQRWQPDADERWLHDYWRARKRLLQALAARQTLWVRQPQSAGDWLLLAMLAEQQHAPAQLYLLDPATAQPRLLGPDERAVLISGWQYWRQHADGLRRWQDGVVVELPANALDHAVLAALPGQGEMSLPQLAAALQPHWPSPLHPAWLAWRVQQLAAAGQLTCRYPDAATMPWLARCPSVALGE